MLELTCIRMLSCYNLSYMFVVSLLVTRRIQIPLNVYSAIQGR